MTSEPSPNPQYPIGMQIGCRTVVDTRRFLTRKTTDTLYWRERVRLGCPNGHVTWYQVWYIAKLLAGQAPDCCVRCTPRKSVQRADLATPRERRAKFCPVCSSCPGRSCARCGGVPERLVSTDAWDRDGEQHTVRL